VNELNEDPKDPKKDKDDELEKLIKELEQYHGQRKHAISYAFLLHKNYIVHLILSFLVNLTMAMTVIGISLAFDYRIVEIEIVGFILAIALLTVIENFVKILLFKYAIRVIIYSLGILSWLVQVVIWYLITLLIPQGFIFFSAWDLIVFSIMFTLMRFIISVYLRRWLYQKDHLFKGGKK
jgi:uncharacterized membrane protein YvlD (DUF360 family)